ncbi:MAG: dolichol-phosphate hexosyltransferase [Solirubrobacteraceae bacterium]|nr:dolichol-phosphate hexosyltransferase [Solirubrobacteraceae bacterium]
MSDAPTLSILMPVYNERPTFETALQRLLDTDLDTDYEVVVIDDGSTDGTRELLGGDRWPDHVRFLQHDRNRGKGAALRTGIAQARGRITAVLDADLEYEPSDLNVMLSPLLEGRANAVFGVRAFDGYNSHSFLYVMGNKGVTLAANILFNIYIKDIMTCHKAAPTELLRSLPLRETGFAIEAELAVRLVQAGARVFEVPVQYQARPTEEGKKLRAIDGARVLRTLIRCRLT